MKKYIITEEQLQHLASKDSRTGNFTFRNGNDLHTMQLEEYSSERTPKKSLLERQTEATENMVDILDKILLYVKPTWALENDIKRYSDRD